MELERERQGQSGTFPAPMVGRRDLITRNPKLKVLDQVREVMRLKHSIRTGGSYTDWIKRYIRGSGCWTSRTWRRDTGKFPAGRRALPRGHARSFELRPVNKGISVVEGVACFGNLRCRQRSY